MQLSKYLAEIEHAVHTVLAELHAEHDQLVRRREELVKLTAEMEDGYRRAEFLALNPDLDDDGLGTAIHWDTYFGPDKERYHKKVEVANAEERVSAREFSVAALSGNLLQYAKQGLAIQFGKKREGCPEGRSVNGLPLHEIIWQGRNQALHWEEGDFHSPTQKCFEFLAANVDRKFAEYKNRSMAYDVVCLLGWRTPEDLMRDMSLFVAAGGSGAGPT